MTSLVLAAAMFGSASAWAQPAATAPAPDKAGRPLEAGAAQPTGEGEAKPGKIIRIGAPTPIAKPDGALRVAVYNVENLFDDHDDPELSGRYEDKEMTKPDAACRAVAEAIRAINADVLALTEVESKQALLWFRDKYIADMGYTYVESPDAGDERGIEQSVLSRYPLSDAKNWVRMDLGGVHPDKWGRDENHNKGKPITFHRSPLRVTVTVPPKEEQGKPYELTLFVVHQKSGGPGNYWREKESARVVQLIGEFQQSNPDANILLMGDFNATPEQRSSRIITEGGMIDLFAPVRGSTGKRVDPLYITHASGRVIDYVYANANAEKELIRETRFILGTPMRPEGADWRSTLPPDGYASDHLPLVIDVIPVDK
ncbi:MAG: endonuclease/exonuclease/phosphatase family protein [Phycisphaerales bacterium]